MKYASHLSAPVFLSPEALGFNGGGLVKSNSKIHRNLTVRPPVVRWPRIWQGSRMSRTKPPVSVEAQWHFHSLTSGRSGSKTSDMCEKHIDICNVGAGDWPAHNFELNKYCGFVKNQTQHRANLLHQPVNVTQMFQHFGIDTMSVTNCSRQVHQTQHNRGLKCQTNPGKIVGGNTHKIRGLKQMMTLRGGRIPESFHRSPFQPSSLWFRLLSRWRREAVRLRTNPRSTPAPRQSQSQ